MIKMNAKQLRQGQGISIKGLEKRNEIYIILDNVLDTYNIGAIFRLADAVAAKKVIICGDSETPPNHRIKKASINTTEVVEWEYYASAREAIEDLRLTHASDGGKIEGLQVVGVELAPGSVPYDKYEYKLPVALVVGHETDGVSKEVLRLCDGIVELPMFGINISLNVMVSLGIVLYKIVETIE